MEENILELRHITKRFAGVVALKDVSLNIRRGEVRALVGENGAGKSTLIKVITGAHEPTEGELWFDGRKIEHNNPSLAKQMGVGVIYQELNLMPHLTVVENLFFGRELKKGPVLDKKRMLDECTSRIAELGVEINPNAKVRELTIAQQQIVEIVKAVSQDIRFLIMDCLLYTSERRSSGRRYFQHSSKCFPWRNNALHRCPAIRERLELPYVYIRPRQSIRLCEKVIIGMDIISQGVFLIDNSNQQSVFKFEKAKN